MNALQLIQAERAKQLALGYNAAHDASHTLGELSRAALARLLVVHYPGKRVGICDMDLLVKFVSPWDGGTALYGQSRVRLLTEAAALLVAELERLMPPAGTDSADRVHTVIAEAIGVFARATGNVGRVADPARRLKVLELLRDYAAHLTNQIAAEIEHLPASTTNPKEDNHAAS